MKALVSGISGQDGSHLADLLLDRGYEVYGTVRRPVSDHFENLARIRDRVNLIQADLADGQRMSSVIRDVRPHEVYNLAAHTFVPSSWDQPVTVAESTGLGVARLLQAILAECPRAKFYQASSSEMYGNAPAPQSEQTPMHPVSPYGAAKLYAHRLVSLYREKYGMFACSGICFNHEGERRARHFVSRKICDTAVAIKAGKADKLVLGTLDAGRDWGYAPDYVRGMFLMLQADEPADYVLATGISHTVGEMAKEAFAVVGLDAADYILQDPNLVRRNEIVKLLGDASNIRENLGWIPETTFEQMVEKMVRHAEGKL